MNAVSPALQAGESVVATVTVDGKVLDTDRIVSIESWNEANRLPRSRIVIYDGDPSSGKFPLSDSAVFAPGAKVTIAAGYGSDSAVLHSGIVIRHSLRIVPGEASQLVVETANQLIAMTLDRSDLVVTNLSDRELIAKLIGGHGGSIDKNEASGDPIEGVVQYQAADWDLLLLRAEANGCIVIIDDAKVNIVAPPADGTAVATIAYGDAIIAFEASVDATAEYAQSAVKSRSWNYATQALGEAGAKAVDVAIPGNFDPSTLARDMGDLPLVQQTGAFLTDAQLAGWSTARLMRARLAEVRGSARVQGDSAIKPGSFVALGGLGQRFDGKAFVSGVRHDIRDGGWTTSVDIGMAPDGFASRNPDIAYPPAAGLVPPIRGLHTGQVKQIATDPKGEFRVLVALPLTGLPDGVWARLGQIYASAGFGALFFPEVGDEVVLGFMDEDPANPVVLGSLY
ncbi:phage baseplate assembly protein V, partial [Allosphingosinicella sp.]|uniref:phage baseplate assembly protein V n=1 Tax=Allosphingosinicella sp. TaxID=2823234 RepID=UPI002F13CD8E